MSYEGREIFICPQGHIYEADCYQFGYSGFDPEDDERDKIVCHVCGEKMKFIGNVDDTNGDSTARFYKKKITPYESIKKEYNPETGTLTLITRPGRYEIIYGEDNEWFNYDTGEKYEYDDDDDELETDVE